MVENPANAIGAEMAGKMEQEAQVERIQTLAGKGVRDPASLAADEIKALCEMILAHLGRSSPS